MTRNAPLLDATQVAEMIGMTVDYVYALARRDEIPHLRFGRTLRFRAEAIDHWLRASERGRLGETNEMARRRANAPGPAQEG